MCCWCWGWWKSCQPRVQAHCLDWVQPRQRVMPQDGGREQGQKREREPPAVAWPWCGSVESVVVNCADGARQGHCITHVQPQKHQTTSDTVSTSVFCPFLSSCTSSISPLRVTASRGHATVLLTGAVDKKADSTYRSNCTRVMRATVMLGANACARLQPSAKATNPLESMQR